MFYLLVGQLAVDRKAQIDLPGSATGVEQTQDHDPIIVGITIEGLVSINGDIIDNARFAGEIKGMHTRSPSTPIQVRADRNAPFGVVRPIMHQLRDAGITRAQLTTEQRP